MTVTKNLPEHDKALIRRAQAQLKQIQQRAGFGGASADKDALRPRVCSPKTIEQYEKAAERVIRQRMQLQAIAALSKNSFYFYRAAINSQMPPLLYQHLVELKQLTPGTPDWDQHLEIIEHCCDLLEDFPADPDQSHLYTLSGKPTWSDLAPPKKDRPKSQTKAQVLSYLPDDWMHRIWNKLPILINRDVYAAEHLRYAIAVLSLTGCRPDELEKGVKVQRTPKGDLLLTIKGSKVSHKSGQEVRQLVVAIDTPWAEELGKAVDRYDGTVWGYAPAKYLNDWVRELGQRCGFEQLDKLQDRQAQARKRAKARGKPATRSALRQIPDTVSPYVYRHAISAGLKQAGWSKTEIAKALGHRVTRTQQYYGKKRQAKKSPISIKAVRATHEIKENTSPPTLRVGPGQKQANGRSGTRP